MFSLWTIGLFVLGLIIGFVGGNLFAEHEIEPDPRKRTRAEMTIPYVAIQDGYNDEGKRTFHLIPQHAAGKFLEQGTVNMDPPPYIRPATKGGDEDDGPRNAAEGTDPV